MEEWGVEKEGRGGGVRKAIRMEQMRGERRLTNVGRGWIGGRMGANNDETRLSTGFGKIE